MTPINTNIAFPKGHWPIGHFPIGHWPRITEGEEYIETSVLAHSPSFIVGSYIIAEDVMSLPSLEDIWPLFKTHVPDEYSNAGVIYDTTPIVDRRIERNIYSQHFGLQIKICSRTQSEGIIITNSLADLFNDLPDDGEVSFGDYLYKIKTAIATTGIVSLGQEYKPADARVLIKDSKTILLGRKHNYTERRFLFTLNYLVVLERRLLV